MVKPISEITEQDAIDDWVDLGNFYARRYNVIGTVTMVYRCYERSDGKQHKSLTRRNGVLLGEVDQRRIPEELANMRIYVPCYEQAVRAWHEYNNRLAEICIRRAFPADFDEDEKLDYYADPESFGLQGDALLDSVKIAQRNMREE